MQHCIDLRSDTVTKPTEEMMKAIMRAELGDDVQGEDPTANRLECMAAELLGKEAGLFVSSGTMGNLVAVLAHTQRRRPEIIAEAMCHIVVSEGGNYAHFGGVAIRSIKARHGIITPEEIEPLIRDSSNVHNPVTSLICLENTHNYAGGTVMTMEQLRAVRELADRHRIPMHLDGARVFNACIAQGVTAAEMAKQFDSVQFCLSKGLCAPVGSVVVGDKEFIREARHYRKMLGGGMRQCGVIAAAGIVALETMVDRLAEDHATARLLAEGLSKIPGVGLDMETVQSNMVRIDTSGMGLEGEAFVELMEQQGVRCGAQAKHIVRFVTHYYIGEEDIKKAVQAVETVASYAAVNR